VRNKTAPIKNHFADILFIVSLAVFIIWFREKPVVLMASEKLDSYFSDNRIGSLIEFFSITIGIYITMLSILAISTTKIMEALSKKSMDQKLLDFMMWGLISSICAVLVLVFMPDVRSGNIILAAVLLWAVIHLIYYFIILFAIFKYNVNNMGLEIDAENRRKEKIEVKLQLIQMDVQEIRTIVNSNRKVR